MLRAELAAERRSTVDAATMLSFGLWHFNNVGNGTSSLFEMILVPGFFQDLDTFKTLPMSAFGLLR